MKKNALSENPSKEKLILIDGHSLCYRAFYAIANLSNSRGEPTNAIYGFVTMLGKILSSQKPERAAICFDRKEPTFRHEQYKEYKAQRKPMPEALIAQMDPIKEFCKISRFETFDKAGYEADDIIGTLARQGKEQGFHVLIVTGDKDAFQLVDDDIQILQPHKDNLICDTKKVEERFDGLGPSKVVDLLALMGDASDNIPGIPGVGEKTAIKLIKEFGSVKSLLEHYGHIKAESLRKKIQENIESLKMSQSLAAIDTEVPLEINWERTKLAQADLVKQEEFFRRYEFRGLLKNLDASAGQNKEAEKRNYRTVEDETELKNLVAKLETSKAFSFDTETTSVDPLRANLVGMSFCAKPFKAFYVPVSSSAHNGKGIDCAKAINLLRPVLENEEIEKYGQNSKYDKLVMERHGVSLKAIEFDTMIASYLINPVKRSHSLDDLSYEYLNVHKIATEELIGKGAKQITMDEADAAKVSEYACEDADCVFRLVPILKKKLTELRLEKLYEEVELPLAEVLAEVEKNGVTIDIDFLKELSKKASKEIDELIKEIYEDVGKSFNLDSPKQLADVLFVQKGLPTSKKTKTGFSTDASVLEKLAETHELPRKILEYRERAKLRSTYLDALPEMANSETNRVHTSFNQTITDTGRLSSSEPNLQNIPIKTENGRLVRKAFIPRSWKTEKGKILSADYSQIELRVLAHFSGDKNLRKAFAEDRDIHSFTATLLYGVDEKDVTREMRSAAKTINFSIVYGKTGFGLSKDLNMSISEADAFIKNYFNRYAGVKVFLDEQKERAKRDGFLTTILGRRAYFPNILSTNMQLRQYAERSAINAPIQGSAADLIKIAMISISKRLKKEGYKSLMILQVHDELVFDVPESEVDKLSKLVKTEMEAVYPLAVPLKADVYIGDSWLKK